MRADQAKRLTKLAANKIKNSVKVEHSVWCHPANEFTDTQTNEYVVSYFDPECRRVEFNTWHATEAFLKNLALKGVPNVQESDGNDV